jgi:hypothetical protein
LKQCNNGGKVVFDADKKYTIGTRKGLERMVRLARLASGVFLGLNCGAEWYQKPQGLGLSALKQCNNGGKVVFDADKKYTIGKALDMTFLKHVDFGRFA